MPIHNRLARLALAAGLCAAVLGSNAAASQASPTNIILVTNVLDMGPGSLRHAILAANNNPGPDAILITASGQLNLTDYLPTITETVIITAPNNNIQGFRIDGQDQYRGLTIAHVPVTITNLIVQDARSLSAAFGGGITSQGSLWLNSVEVLSSKTGGRGGAVNGAGSVVVNGGRFQGNSSTDDGGAINAGGALVVNGSTIRNNFCVLVGCDGGGLHAEASLTLTNTEVISNTSFGLGGGAFAAGAADVSGGKFERNQTSYGGGGLYAAAGLLLTGTLFISNTAPSGGGDGGGVNAAGGLTIIRAEFRGNSAINGGGLLHQAGSGSIVNTLFAGNTASGNAAAIALEGAGTDTLKHVTIANSAPVSGAAATTTKGTVAIQNVIIANHAVGLRVTSGVVGLDNCLFFANGLDIDGSVAFDHDRAAGNPKFVSPAAGNYHLQFGSAAMDAGLDAGVNFDFDGDPRPALNGFDIGYDEAVFRLLMLPLIRR
jgi:predicted outer membrane repeat protein